MNTTTETTPFFIRPTTWWSNLLWDLDPEEMQCNIDWLNSLGGTLCDGGKWFYPDLGVVFVRVAEEDDEILWRVDVDAVSDMGTPFTLESKKGFFNIALEEDFFENNEGIAMIRIDDHLAASISVILSGFNPYNCVDLYLAKTQQKH